MDRKVATIGSLHISYHLSELMAYRHGLLQQALLRLARRAVAHLPHPRIIDVGCGRGELMALMAQELGAEVHGLDSDSVCVSMSGVVGQVWQADIGNLPEGLAADLAGAFDLVIMSHVLEHLESPYQVMQTIGSFSRQAILLAVPNPHYLPNLLRSVLGRVSDVNAAHLYSWDAAHWRNFLERHLHLKIVQWEADYVPFAFPSLREKLLASRGWDFLDGRLLPRAFPRLAESLIVLCEKHPEAKG